MQRLLIDRALHAVANEPAVIGAFLWKWFPGDRVPRDFALQRPEVRAVIGRRWGHAAP